jgi:hypothetical protein
MCWADGELPDVDAGRIFEQQRPALRDRIKNELAILVSIDEVLVAINPARYADGDSLAIIVTPCDNE